MASVASVCASAHAEGRVVSTGISDQISGQFERSAVRAPGIVDFGGLVPPKLVG